MRTIKFRGKRVDNVEGIIKEVVRLKEKLSYIGWLEERKKIYSEAVASIMKLF
jgi:hypothetical protein